MFWLLRFLVMLVTFFRMFRRNKPVGFEDEFIPLFISKTTIERCKTMKVLSNNEDTVLLSYLLKGSHKTSSFNDKWKTLISNFTRRDAKGIIIKLLIMRNIYK